MVLEYEASFRQSPTLHATWFPFNSQPQIPSRGERNTQKILGAVSVGRNQLLYRHPKEYFNVHARGACEAGEVHGLLAISQEDKFEPKNGSWTP